MESPTSKKSRPVWPRTRKATPLEVRKNLKEMYEELKEGGFYFNKRVKTTRGLHKGHSRRRSRYVGVSKNRHHYQTLLTTKRNKKYIGTYLTEEQAALTYDFYSFGLNGLNAKTNFSHSGEEVMQMIKFYFDND
mmetsp:Transcript_29225/g.25845  ORF Transcript_29225/g.25845 Transcript_29225/m.25845 type:complete len:134 (+) Transcript_29225:167-568(+)